MRRTAMSLFIDDTEPRPPGVFGQVLDFLAAQGVRGKVSAIPGLNVGHDAATLGKSDLPRVQAYVAELARADACGFDLHMELMTHNNLWDFATGTQRTEGPHESIWIYDPEVSVAEYEAYFGGVLDNLAPRGLVINGVTVPGCDCEACDTKWETLQAKGYSNVSVNAWQALLNLAAAGRFGVPVVAVFSDESDAAHPTRMIARRGDFGVYDARLDMSVEDLIGFRGIDPDFYITEDGQSGRIAELVHAGAAQCFFVAHWHTMNPRHSQGWEAFQAIIRRINATLGDRIEWVKPSEYGQRLLEA